jgi:pyruvate formate-lyase/glycerol dehydratase family glycyl radical enzyme
MLAVQVDEEILRQIDGLTLSERLLKWRKAVKEAPYKLYTDRQKYATESWKATEGEDIEIRRAKLFKHIAENIEIKIHDFDLIAGRMTPGIIGAYTAIDVCGDYIDDIWNEDNRIGLTMNASTTLNKEDIEILREAARTYGGKTAPDMANKAWEAVLGSWPKDVETARIKDPPLNTGNLGNSTNTVMFEKILNKGLKSFIEEARSHINDFISKQEQNASKLYFWQAAIIVCEATITLARRYAALAREMTATEPDAVRKAELLEMAETCEYVPENPARTFREALQSMAIIGIGKGLEHPMHNHPQWGRGDQYLYPYFIRDIRNGTLTVEKAGDLLAELIGRWGTQLVVDTGIHKETHQINFGINSINLGGINQDGKDASNELSYLFLHMVGLLHISSPTVGLRWNRETPDWLMRKAIKTNILTGGGIPLFENEEVIIRHFVEDGIPLAEAREWIGLGCVWPVLPTRSEYKGGAAATNAAAILHITLHNGVAITNKKLGLETGDPRSFTSFDQLLEAFKAQYKFFVHRTLWLANIARDEQYKYIRLPYLSTMSLQFCMDEGQDTMVPHLMSQYGITDRAIIDTADSLFAIKKLVYDEQRLSMSELMDALDSNFQGPRGEEIRQLCLAVPKFGNDIDEIDLFTKEISEFSAAVVTGYDNSPYQNFKSVREGLSWHYAAGLGVGALPNGRKALEPLNDGSASPMRGCDKNGPTAVLRSVLKARFYEHSYVQALNQKFTPSVLSSEESIDKLVAYTNAFLKNGGTHIQYNIVDKDELLDAKVHPEEHKDLIVRVGGFSAYFVQLSPQIQDDVILRSEHNL